ncbi:MAG: amidohydrolase family protein, partial [Coprococcus sp.]
DAKLKDGTRAGSTLTTGQAFRNLMKFTGESPEKILPLLTENPATMLGLQNSIGFISEGKDADVLIMDSEFQIKETFVKGRRII